jgi:hypothetical protein
MQHKSSKQTSKLNGSLHSLTLMSRKNNNNNKKKTKQNNQQWADWKI